jgi:hypothetical protein
VPPAFVPLIVVRFVVVVVIVVPLVVVVVVMGGFGLPKASPGGGGVVGGLPVVVPGSRFWMVFPSVFSPVSLGVQQICRPVLAE